MNLSEENYTEYSIIGSYYTVKKENNRLKGFVKLSDKKLISNHLKKTKLCEIKQKYGVCRRKICNFAHSMEELCIPLCAFGKECNRRETCQFLHPDDYVFKK